MLSAHTCVSTFRWLHNGRHSVPNHQSHDCLLNRLFRPGNAVRAHPRQHLKDHTVHIVHLHYNDVIIGTMASQITRVMIVYSSVYSGADQRKHQRSASLAFVRGIHRGPVNSPHKWPVTRKMFPFDDVIMSCLWIHWSWVRDDIINCKDTSSIRHRRDIKVWDRYLTGVGPMVSAI